MKSSFFDFPIKPRFPGRNKRPMFCGSWGARCRSRVWPRALRAHFHFWNNSVGAQVASFAAHFSQPPPSEKSSAVSAILSTLKGGSAGVSNKSSWAQLESSWRLDGNMNRVWYLMMTKPTFKYLKIRNHIYIQLLEGTVRCLQAYLFASTKHYWGKSGFLVMLVPIGFKVGKRYLEGWQKVPKDPR